MAEIGGTMELLPEDLKKLIPPLGSLCESSDPQLCIKYFTPDGGWTWYVAEGEPQAEGDYLFYGYVIGVEAEWGDFSLSELKSVRGRLGLPVERDLFFKPTPAGAIEQRGY